MWCESVGGEAGSGWRRGVRSSVEMGPSVEMRRVWVGDEGSDSKASATSSVVELRWAILEGSAIQHEQRKSKKARKEQNMKGAVSP